MEKVPNKIRRPSTNWKNCVENDLRLLLDKKGALGAVVTSRSGDIVTQVFKDPAKDESGITKQKENALMQLVKKAVQTLNGTRNAPLRSVTLESEEGSVILYNAENAFIGCLLDKGYDAVSVKINIGIVGDLIKNDLNNGELTEEQFDRIVARDPEEVKALAYELVENISRHYGEPITDEFIKFTLKRNQPRWAAR
jgi:predicted regulator of Ras-like GTPase activity (Roadblock/LC7/MglB family)